MINRKDRIEKLPSSLLPWYAECGRMLPWREDPLPYHVWLSEIMLQQTRIEAVKPYYARFLWEIPDIPALAEADPEHLHKLWEGLGYYSRVKNLQAAAQQIMQKHGGRFPEDYDSIRALRGIGEYTAGAIASICFDLPTPAVDGNVLRVVARITGDTRPVTKQRVRSSVRAELSEIYPAGHCGEFTQAIMELGETVCIPNGTPACGSCPCSEFCASRDGKWSELPVKAKKKPRRMENMTVFILRCGDCTALRKRDDTGLLSGMWELPNVLGFLCAEDAEMQAEDWGCSQAECLQEFQGKHIFTHEEWNMRCFLISCSTKPDCFVWPDSRMLQEDYALPTAFRRLLHE